MSKTVFVGNAKFHCPVGKTVGWAEETIKKQFGLEGGVVMGPSGCLDISDIICDAHGRLEFHYEPGKEKLSSVVYRLILSLIVLILKLVSDWTKYAQVSLLGDKSEMVLIRNEVASILHNVCEHSNTNFVLQKTKLSFRQISGWLQIQEYYDYVLIHRAFVEEVQGYERGSNVSDLFAKLAEDEYCSQIAVIIKGSSDQLALAEGNMMNCLTSLLPYNKNIAGLLYNTFGWVLFAYRSGGYVTILRGEWTECDDGIACLRNTIRENCEEFAPRLSAAINAACKRLKCVISDSNHHPSFLGRGMDGYCFQVMRSNGQRGALKISLHLPGTFSETHTLAREHAMQRAVHDALPDLVVPVTPSIISRKLLADGVTRFSAYIMTQVGAALFLKTDALEALVDLHAARFVHGDSRLPNLIVCADHVCRWIDFRVPKGRRRIDFRVPKGRRRISFTVASVTYDLCSLMSSIIDMDINLCMSIAREKNAQVVFNDYFQEPSLEKARRVFRMFYERKWMSR